MATLVENSIANIINVDKNKMNHNGLDYELNIDSGTIVINDETFPFSLESNNIHINGMCYHFDGYMFNICNNLVKARGSVYHIDTFLINTARGGRIRIGGQYHYFSIVNNVLTVGETRVYNAAENNNLRQYNIRQNVREHVFNPDANVVNIATDSQNVHNSIILNRLKIILNKIQENTKITKTMNQSLKEIRAYFLKISLTGFRNLNSILNEIQNSNGYIMSFGMKELEVLHIIWNAIYDNNDLKHILYTNMLGMRERGNLVCLTGRVTRMIDIFSGIIDEYTFKDKNIREEMMNKCAKIRTDLNIDDEEKLKEEIKKVLYKDYVESKIMTIDAFNTEVNEWIDYI